MESGVLPVTMEKTELRMEIDATLLEEARTRGVALDAAAEHGIRIALARQGPVLPIGIVAALECLTQLPGDVEARAMRWSEENAAAIEAYRRRIDAFGVFGEDLRNW